MQYGMHWQKYFSIGKPKNPSCSKGIFLPLNYKCNKNLDDDWTVFGINGIWHYHVKKGKLLLPIEHPNIETENKIVLFTRKYFCTHSTIWLGHNQKSKSMVGLQQGNEKNDNLRNLCWRLEKTANDIGKKVNLLDPLHMLKNLCNKLSP